MCSGRGISMTMARECRPLGRALPRIGAAPRYNSTATRHYRDAGLHDDDRHADRAQGVLATLVRLPSCARHPSAGVVLHEGHLRDDGAQRGVKIAWLEQQTGVAYA